MHIPGEEDSQEFRSFKHRLGVDPLPPKRYFLQSNEILPIKGYLISDLDPVSLPPTKLPRICLGLGKSPWPISGFPTWNGLVLIRTENQNQEEYRRIGVFSIDRDNKAKWMKRRIYII
jgi:hypothetical protein